MTELEHRHVTANGVRLHVVEAGAGEPVLLLHGWPQHWWMWRELIGPLAERYRVVCPDLRGLGWSEAPRRGYTRGAMTRDILALLDTLGLERVRIVATDWGLLLAYWLALFWPWRVEQLVALGGPHIWAVSGTPPTAYLRFWHFSVLASPFGALAVRAGLARHALKSWRHHGEFRPDELATYLERTTRPESARATARRYRRIVADFLFFARYSRDLGLAVPTLSLVPEHDKFANASPPNRYTAENAVDFRYELIPNCGHFPAEEQPEVVLERILWFFSQPTSARSMIASASTPGGNVP